MSICLKTVTVLLAAELLGTVLSQPELTFPVFTEEAGAAGVAHSYTGDWPFLVGGGVAAFDCDANGFPDLFFAGGEDPASLYRNRSEQGGELRFEAVKTPAALPGVTGVYPLDIDADALQDLVLLRVGENVVYRGLGDCIFERANEAWNIDGGRAWTTAFSAAWLSGAKRPTLFFGNYIDQDAPGAPFGTCEANILLRPDPEGDMTFRPPERLEPSYCALSALFTDWNRSGHPSLRVSNDRQYYLTNADRSGGEQLWHIDEVGAEPYSAADGWQPLQIWGMGIASADLSGDGYPEVYLTSMADNKLRVLGDPGDNPEPHYRDAALERGVTAHRPHTGDDMRPSTGWHAEFADVNNDGLLDLFVAKGNVEDMTDFALADPNNLLLGQADGTFVEGAVTAGVASSARSRGAALSDLNLDGHLDLVVNNRRERVKMWRNIAVGGGNWLELRLSQPGGNRDAVGAWVEVLTPQRHHHTELHVGGGHAGGRSGWLHIGLGAAESALIKVHWPGGGESAWLSLSANAFYMVERGKLSATEWLP